MSDVFEHNPGDHEDPRAGITWFIGFVGSVAFVVTVLAVWALYYNMKGEQVQESFVAPAREEVAELKRSQEALLAGPPRYIEVDESGETVSRYIIPIEQAMQLVVQETGGR